MYNSLAQLVTSKTKQNVHNYKNNIVTKMSLTEIKQSSV